MYLGILKFESCHSPIKNPAQAELDFTLKPPKGLWLFAENVRFNHIVKVLLGIVTQTGP